MRDDLALAFACLRVDCNDRDGPRRRIQVTLDDIERSLLELFA